MSHLRLPSSTSLLSRLIAEPDLVRTVRSLPDATFSALIRHIGVEDASELIALATTEQIVAAFDEDLFVAEAPGEREAFDRHRFVVWLEVLLEAGDAAAARRLTELSQDFVVHAFSQLVLVLDRDALFARLRWDDSEATYLVDKALESSLVEAIDGYLLVAKEYEGWDALISLILALDRDYRWLLERILDRCAALQHELVEDADALYDVLTSAESLAEDVEGEREERRGRQGFVEPRAARGFLALARMPIEDTPGDEPRDATTRAYFHSLDQAGSRAGRVGRGAKDASSPALGESLPKALASLQSTSAIPDLADTEDPLRLVEALQVLAEEAPGRFDERMAELVYLANTLLAAAVVDGRGLRPAEAGEAALATVALGAELEVRALRAAKSSQPASKSELCMLLRTRSADLLFRRASSALASLELQPAEASFLRKREDVRTALDTIEIGVLP